jgi:hypothetical protein
MSDDFTRTTENAGRAVDGARAATIVAGIVIAASLVLGVAGCGGDGDTKTVTAVETVTSTVGAPAATATSPSGADGATASVGPPLPAGVLGVDGRYRLKTVSTDYDAQNIGVARFSAYEAPSNARTRCVGSRCSVTFRLGLKSGGSKTYTLRADPARERTYVGTGTGQITCLDTHHTRVGSRERIAVRAGSATEIAGRQVAGRLSLYATITARCPAIVGTGRQTVRFVATLRGPRESSG